MFKHYLDTALRHFRQHKFSTAINVACLALGLICFLISWGIDAYYDQSDAYHERSSRTFVFTTKQSDSGFTMNSSPWLLAEHLRADFPALEAVARVFYPQEAAVTSNGVNSFAQISYADPEFLTIFDLPFVHGGGRDALRSPRTAIVSQRFAQRLFGTDNAVGRSFRLSGRAESLTVTGVVGEIPQPSHMSTTTISPTLLSFEAILSMDANAAARGPHRWDNNWYFTYAVLPLDGSITRNALDGQMDAFATRHIPTSESTSSRYRLQPVSEFTAINLDSLAGADRTGISSMGLLKILGALVLLVAGLNYANLATAQATTRAKEIAMRRVVGANRGQVVAQHLVESLLLTMCALSASLVLLALTLVMLDPQLLLSIAQLFVAMPRFWGLLLTLLAVVSALTAAYPALVLARVRPASALRGAKIKGGSRTIATFLIGVQFASASFLVIAVLIMAEQHRELRQAVWNAADDPVVVIANDLRTASVDVRLLKEELMRTSSVRAVTGMHRMPWGLGGNAEPLSASDVPGANSVSSGFTIVDSDILQALNMRILAGRTFDASQASDTANVRAWNGNDFSAASDFNIVIDKSTLRFMGFASADDAVGKTLFHPTSQNGTTPAQRMHIIGVTEDSVIRPINLGGPSFYLMSAESAIVPVIRIAKQNVSGALADIDAVWKKLAPEVPLKRRFADEQFDVSYRFLGVINSMFSLLAGFAIAIATMGLFGIAMHVIGRRRHEIGVRKTLGASANQVLWMLLRNFSKPVVIANLAVWPIAFLAMRGYLSLFAHRAGLSLLPFLAALAITVAIAWLAVVAQATRAARLNPATVLRYE